MGFPSAFYVCEVPQRRTFHTGLTEAHDTIAMNVLEVLAFLL